MIRTTLALLLAGATAFSAPAARRDLSDADRLEKALSGRVAGEPRSCIQQSPSGGTQKFGNTVLIEDRAGKLFRTQLVGGCIARDWDALITRSTITSLCRGDIVDIADLQAGFTRSSCSFSDFTPYTKPKR